MIDVDSAIFPNNVIELLAIPMGGIDSDLTIYKRTLKNTDNQQSIGLFAQMWDPQEDSLEMRGAGDAAPQRPTLQRYIYGIQAFVKDGERERGLAVHSTLAHRVRAVLYTHAPLRVALAALKVEFADGSVESVQRWGITTARYFSNEVDGVNLYLSTLEFWVETETH